MTAAILGVPGTVSDALIAEIDSIKVTTGETGSDVTYAPDAYTREGRTD